MRKALKQPTPAIVFSVDSLSVRQGGLASATVLNVINDTAKSKLFLVNRRTAVNNPIRLTAITEQGIAFSIPASIDTGYYTLRLQSGLYTIDAPVVYRAMLPVPTISATNPTANIRTGDDITFTGKGFGEIAEVWCVFPIQELIIIFRLCRKQLLLLQYGFPAGAVTGSYVYARIILPGTGTNSISLSATGKKFIVIP